MKNVFQRVKSIRSILVVGMGTTPAVLSEAAWVLAHQEQPVMPDVMREFKFL